MNTHILSKIDSLIKESRQELADLTKKLVNIKSVLEPAAPGAPFGEGVKKVLDTAVMLGKEKGLFTQDYNVGVVSIALKEGQPDLGIWVHGDVVPEGTGWSFEPYNAVEYEGRIVGRGAGDNKGQLAAMLILLDIFKKLDIKLKYTPALYIGSNEEKGMLELLGMEGNPDAKGFLNLCTPPKMSLVPDGAFPVGYGGKGNLMLMLKTVKPLKGLRVIAGQDDAPGKAVAVFENRVTGNFKECTVTYGKNTTVEISSLPVHNAKPVPGGNMITTLARELIASGVLDGEDIPMFDFLQKMSADTTGSMFGIDVETNTMAPLSVSTFKIDDIDGCMQVNINIRYPIEITAEEIIERITRVSGLYGFVFSDKNIIHKPYLLDKDSEIVKTLCRVSNDVTGMDQTPYTVQGGTYAHELPNAYVFGSSANLRPESWEAPRGSAHSIDEVVSLDRLQRAMKIYARALLELNEKEW